MKLYEEPENNRFEKKKKISIQGYTEKLSEETGR